MTAFKGGYTNGQWAVVPCGLYCRERGYLIGKDDIADLRQGAPGNLQTWVDGRREAHPERAAKPYLLQSYGELTKDCEDFRLWLSARNA